MKCTYARVTFQFSEQFQESVQEMIDDGEFSTEDEIKQYLTSCLMEDIEDWINHSPNQFETNKHLIFDITIDK